MLVLSVVVFALRIDYACPLRLLINATSAALKIAAVRQE
jgi:hypothetical protein